MSNMEAPANDHWLIPKKWPKRLFWLLIAAGAVYLFALLPITDDYTDRARVSELLAVTAEAREKVGKALLENPHGRVVLNAQSLIPDAIGVRSKEGERIEIAYRDIAENGEIKVYSPQLGALLIFTPKVAENKVTWSCWGRPLKRVPAPCRGDS